MAAMRSISVPVVFCVVGIGFPFSYQLFLSWFGGGVVEVGGKGGDGEWLSR